MPFYSQNIKLENERLVVYLNIVRELKNVKLEDDSSTHHSWQTWKSPEEPSKKKAKKMVI